MRSALRILGKMTWVELKLFIREPITMAFTFALPVIFLVVMGGVFGNTPDPEGKVYGGVGPLNYYTPAYIAMVISSIGVVGLPVHIAAYRERRILRRLRASSMSVWTVLGSQVLVSFVIAVLGSILLSAVSFITYHADFPKQLALFIPAFVLGSISFSALGFFLGAVLPTTRAAQGIGIILFFLMLILGGAGPPREVLDTPMRIIGDATPVWYVIQLLQGPWLGKGWNLDASLIVAGITVVATLLSARFFRWE